ncbi:membrane protein insertase YidC, partial [Oleiphilus sp. HI0079]|uniref:membrane protein insertase YidC n=3 Tax=unclassified Oleiphilus TaxID=2631174 RepID=UPI000B137478
MDIRRTIIFIGLAVVSYMLVLEWNADYGQAVTQTTNASQVNQQTSSTRSTMQTELEVGNTDSEHEFSVPSNQEDANQAPSSDSDGQLIRVTTDVLDLTIDTEGGNLQQALMLNYDETLNSEAPLALLQNDQQRLYTVESGLFGKNGFDSSKNGGKPIYQVEQTTFELGDEEELQVDLKYTSESGVELTKRYTFKRDDYLINVEYLINNQSSEVFEANFSGKIVRDRSVDPSSQTSMGMQSYLGMVLSSEQEPYEKIDFDDMLESPVNQQIQGGWLAFIQHYFISAWIPDSEVMQTYQTRVKNGLYLMGYISPATVVQ